MRVTVSFDIDTQTKLPLCEVNTGALADNPLKA